MKNNMRILVTGAAGFIGFFLIKLLCKNNFKVIGVDNLNTYYDVNLKKKRLEILKKSKNFSFYKLDIKDGKKIESIFKKKIDVVVNLAAMAGVRHSLKHPMDYIDSNIVGFVNLINFHVTIKLNISYMLVAQVFTVIIKNIHLVKKILQIVLPVFMELLKNQMK